jgi:hypothetical protein
MSKQQQYQRADLISSAVDLTADRIEVRRHSYQPVEGDEEANGE